MINLKNKVVLVIGVIRGIGKGIVIVLGEVSVIVYIIGCSFKKFYINDSIFGIFEEI